jgi:hypothetical protein
MEQEQEKQIREYLCRPARYANVDGVTEMTAGLTWFGLALFGWIPSVTPKGSVWHSMLLLWLLLVAWVALVAFGAKAFKKHVTYPRTGLVSYPAARGKASAIWRFAFVLVIAAVVSAALAYMAARKHFQPVWLMGASMAFFYGMMARPMRPWKWAILTLMAAGGVGLVFLPGGLEAQVLIGLASYGAVFLAAGLITLAHYLRHSQPAEKVAE